MNHYLVITPEYGEVIPITDEGLGPTEYQCDVVEIEADTKRDALLLGVNFMRKHTRDFPWFQHCDGNPFVGIKVERVQTPCRT